MEEVISRIQAVRNTLEGFDIVSRKDTMLKLLGCQQILDEVLNTLRTPPEKGAEEQNGNTHAE